MISTSSSSTSIEFEDSNSNSLVKFKLKVSRNTFKNYKTLIANDISQAHASQFFSECTRDQQIIQNLLTEKYQLKTELERVRSSEFLKHPQFLKELIDQSVLKNSGRKLSYTDHLKKISLQIFLLSGPTAYNLLQKNLPLPSLSTVRRRLGEESPLQEGEFQVESIMKELSTSGEPMLVWIAEDDTKVTPRLHYNVRDDSIVGLELPLDELSCT